MQSKHSIDQVFSTYAQYYKLLADRIGLPDAQTGEAEPFERKFSTGKPTHAPEIRRAGVCGETPTEIAEHKK